MSSSNAKGPAPTESDLLRQDYGDLLNLISAAGLVDTRYPVKGCVVWMPDGFELKERVFAVCEKAFRDLGYKRYEFPRLIPGSTIKKVTSGVADFEGGLFWLRRNDGKPLDLFLTPTGETSVYTMFKKWIKEERDLPLRLFQIGHTFRPHKRPNALLNPDEYVSLIEAHAAFATRELAAQEFKDVVTRFEMMHDDMGLPYLVLSRPIEGNKPVAVSMVSFESYLPSKETSFNVGVVYDQSNIYSKAMEVDFRQEDGTKTYTEQVTFGLCERAIAVMLDLHKDKYGIRLMPQFAPTQITIIPVSESSINDSEKVLDACNDVKKSLSDFRVEIDDRKSDSRKKFAKARAKGIPIRIGISNENIVEKTVRVYLRTQDEPITVGLKDLPQKIVEYFQIVHDDLIANAYSIFENSITVVEDVEKLQNIVDDHKIAKIYCCDDTNCRKSISSKSSGEILGIDVRDNSKGECLSCGKSAPVTYFSRRNATP